MTEYEYEYYSGSEIWPNTNTYIIRAVLYYTSQYFICWDFVGMTIEDLKCVGIDPNSYRPKPRPTTPRNLFDSIHFQYQKQM